MKNPIKEMMREACAEAGIKFVEVKRMNYPPMTGLFVRVYQDPYTMQKLEGIARLEKKIEDNDEAQRWMVRFVTKDGTLEDESFERLLVRPCVANATYEEAML